MKLGEGATPGPWIAEDNPNGKKYSTRVVHHINHNSLDQIAYVCVWTKADGYLIAKAPLLIECRDVLERAEEQFTILLGEHGLSGDNNPTVKAIRALLAKLES